MNLRSGPKWMPERWATACVLALALCTHGAAVRAQRAPGGDAATARASFQRGITALDEGRYRDAIDALEESRRLRDVPVVWYNLALAYRGVGRQRDAIAAFERYLAQPDPRATSSEMRTVRSTLVELRASLATLEVRVTPAQASILVDGQPVALAAGQASMDSGSHVVEAACEGFTAERREIVLRPGERTRLALTLRPVGGPARLVVVPSVGNAVTSVDGVRQPMARVDRALSPGVHVVTIRASGYENFERRITLGTTGVVRVEAHLSALARSSNAPLVVSLTVAGGLLVAGGVIAGLVLAGMPRQGDLQRLPATTLPTVFE